MPVDASSIPSALPPDDTTADAARIAALQDAISAHLTSDVSLQQSIRALIANSNRVEDVQRLLKDARVVEKIELAVRQDLQKTRDEVGSDAVGHNQAVCGKRNVLISVTRGLAFLNPRDVADDPTSSLELHATLFGRRLSPSPAPVPSTTEPNFSARWVVELPSSDLLTVLSRGGGADGLRLLVTRRNHITGIRDLVGCREVEWRDALAGGVVSRMVELRERLDGSGVGGGGGGKADASSGGVTVGLIEIFIELIPLSTSLPNCASLSREDISIQFKREMREDEDMRRAFHVYARRWWNDYLAIRTSHAERLVKIFAEDEEGRKLPVWSFVSPIKSRCIESPRIAARFVSLIGITRQQNIGSDPHVEIWHSPHTILTLTTAIPASHATLLASLLLGLSMNAYVTLGTDKKNNAEAWVTTISIVAGRRVVEFWDPVHGLRHVVTSTLDDALQSHRFRTIGCLFNHSSFYANISPSDSISKISFNLSDASTWKPISADAIAPFRNTNNYSSVTINPYDPPRRITVIEDEIEAYVESMVERHRDEHDLTTQFDRGLAHLMSQSLSDAESSRLDAVSHRGTGDFLECVRGYIPEGHIFKAVPVCCGNFSDGGGLARVWRAVERSLRSGGLLVVRGDKVRFGVRARVFGYGENVAAVWVLVGARFKPFGV